MQTSASIRAIFNSALDFDRYVASAKPNEQSNWKAFEARVALSPDQVRTLRASTRRINILVISGTWCGDCVQQCPILAHIERACPADRARLDAPGIDLRFIDRDEHRDFAESFKICGGYRVPTVIFLNEDFDFVALMGDRTLSRYRAIASRQLGPSCPLPGAPVPTDEIAATTQDWVNECERVALFLRLSARLREKHAD